MNSTTSTTPAAAPMTGTWTIADFDWIVINTSAGKDSQAMLDLVAELARAAGVEDRVVAVHCDLGRVEWEGTLELARDQVARYGFRFEVVSRIGGVAKRDSKAYKAGEVYGDLLDYVERRGMWPDVGNRFCTSEFKRGPVQTLHTRLAAEWRATNPEAGRPCRILNAMGMRAQESAARSKLVPFEVDERNSNGRKTVVDWLPIHHWTVGQVWDRIRTSGVPHHRAYDLGMTRLSCAFCIFAPERALMIAGEHNPSLLAEYVRVERATGHGFRGTGKRAVRLAVIQERLHAGERATGESDDGGCWGM